MSTPALQPVEVSPQREPETFDPFRTLSREEREQQLEECRRVLRARDGILDFERRTLSNREAFFRDLACHPVSLEASVDREAFYERFYRRSKPPVDRLTLWMLAVAKANEGESYGADGEVERYARRGFDGVDPAELHIVFQERYHGRLLAEACRALGVDIEVQKPSLAMRIFILLVQYLPASVRYVPIMGGEIAGCIVFRILADMSELVPRDRGVAARVRLLFEELLGDEVIHVLYCRARLGPWRMRFVRLIFPLVVVGLFSAIPELGELGCNLREIRRRLRGGVPLPEGWQGREPVRS